MGHAAGILKHWLPLAAVSVVLCGLVCLTVQQVLRQDANDPQIQMAEDAASAAASGAAVESLLPAGRVDVGRSLAPFMIFYDDAGTVVASSGFLHDQAPLPPEGVLDFVRANGEHRVSWQPESGVRIAAVIVRHRGTESGYVLAGRSLREVERRKDLIAMYAGIALIACLAASLLAVVLGEWLLTPAKTATAPETYVHT
jgi:hypothetical protein